LADFYSGLKGRRIGFTLIELIVILVVLGILASLAFISYKKWRLRMDVENSVRKLQSEIEYYRVVAFTQKEPIDIKILNNKVVVSSPSFTKSFNLPAPYSGSVKIDSKGLLSPGSIVYAGPMVDAKYSCLKINRVRVRPGKTVIKNGKRVCQ